MKLTTQQSYVIFAVQFLHRGVEQLVARRAHNPKVAGSSPVPATKEKPRFFLGFRILKYEILCLCDTE